MKAFFFMLLASVLFEAAAATPPNRQILIYTRNYTPDGKGYVHENIAASVRALQEIGAELGLTTVVSDDPSIFTPEGLRPFGAVVFANSNNEAFATDEQRRAFQEYIRSGKGFVGIHSACGSERNWPWFWAMLGGKFRRHPPLQPFDLVVVDSTHLSTSFLPRPWKWEDECYYIEELNPDIRVLLAADLSTLEDPKRGEYPGRTFGDYFPLAWYHTFEGGRQWYTALGHKPEHYQDPLFREHLKGGIQWALDMKS